tara:strand:- start:11556 stop:11933 length:378 start_codon:yes stop_codon:yes gene_type:complete
MLGFVKIHDHTISTVGNNHGVKELACGTFKSDGLDDVASFQIDRNQLATVWHMQRFQTIMQRKVWNIAIVPGLADAKNCIVANKAQTPPVTTRGTEQGNLTQGSVVVTSGQVVGHAIKRPAIRLE